MILAVVNEYRTFANASRMAGVKSAAELKAPVKVADADTLGAQVYACEHPHVNIHELAMRAAHREI